MAETDVDEADAVCSYAVPEDVHERIDRLQNLTLASLENHTPTDLPGGPR